MSPVIHPFSLLARAFLALLLCATLAGCHTSGLRQFQLPDKDRDAVVAQVRLVAQAHGMYECETLHKAVGTISCYFAGGGASTASVVVRQIDTQVVVDVGYQSAFIGNGLFDVLSEEVRTALRRACGAADVKEPRHGEEIPAMRAPF